jgi:hypothetical protein
VWLNRMFVFVSEPIIILRRNDATNITSGSLGDWLIKMKRQSYRQTDSTVRAVHSIRESDGESFEDHGSGQEMTAASGPSTPLPFSLSFATPVTGCQQNRE